jgi:hypothetical protein
MILCHHQRNEQGASFDVSNAKRFVIKTYRLTGFGSNHIRVPPYKYIDPFLSHTAGLVFLPCSSMKWIVLDRPHYMTPVNDSKGISAFQVPVYSILVKNSGYNVGRAGTKGRQAWQLPGAQWLITIFLRSVNSALCGIYFYDASSHRRKTDGQILSLDSCSSSSEYDIAKTINFNDVTDEFASVKATRLHCKFSIVHEKY